jgi:hypothetical protein
MSFSPEQIQELETFLKVQFEVPMFEKMLKNFGLKFPKLAAVKDPLIEAKKKARAAFDLSIVGNESNDFQESHDDWKKVKADYGGAFCDDALKLNGKIAYTFTFEEAIRMADEHRCEAITKTKYGYKVCEASIPIKGQATKPNQSIMAWTKTETEFEYPYDRTVVVPDRRVMARFYAANMKAKMEFKLHGIVPTKPEPEKPKKKATKKKAAPKKKAAAPEPEPEPEPEPVSDDESEELDVDRVWNSEGKMFYKDDEGKYYDIDTKDEVEAFEECEEPESEKPKPKKVFALKKD